MYKNETLACFFSKEKWMLWRRRIFNHLRGLNNCLKMSKTFQKYRWKIGKSWQVGACRALKDGSYGGIGSVGWLTIYGCCTGTKYTQRPAKTGHSNRLFWPLATLYSFEMCLERCVRLKICLENNFGAESSSTVRHFRTDFAGMYAKINENQV